jgi:ABC-type Fe3+ transport system substrate-binding protein
MTDIMMTDLKKLLVAGAAGLAVLAAAAATAPAPAAEISPALKAVAEAANKEGTLKLFLHGGAWGDGRGIQRVQAGMNKMFGTKIEIKYAFGPSMGAIGNQLMAEFKANRPAATDLYYGNGPYAVPHVTAKTLVPIDWSALLPGRITDDMEEAGGMALRFGSNLRQIAYNKNVLPNPPQRLEGYLAPALKGKLATTPYAAGFTELIANPGWNGEKVLKYATALSEQISGLIGCGDEHRVASGEFAAMVFTCGGDVEALADKGAPIGVVTPRDFVAVSYFYVMVPKHAEHPNAAKLLIAYLMTEEGQKLNWELERRDLHSFKGSHSAEVVDPAAKAATNGVIWRTLEWSLANKEDRSVIPEVIKVFRSKSGGR